MGFIQPNKQGGQDDAIEALGAQRFKPSREDDGGSADTGVELDLDLRACEVCRRELLPWQETCPDDGGNAVQKSDLPPQRDPLLERMLAEEQGDTGEPPPGGDTPA